MIKPEALLILKEKFSSCTCQLLESGVSGLFSGFRTHPLNTPELSISALLQFFSLSKCEIVCILVFEESTGSNFLIFNLLERQDGPCDLEQCGKTLLQYVAFHFLSVLGRGNVSLANI